MQFCKQTELPFNFQNWKNVQTHIERLRVELCLRRTFNKIERERQRKPLTSNSSQIMLVSVLKRRSILQNISAFLRKNSYSAYSTFDVNEIKHRTKVPLKPVVSLDAIPSEKVSFDQKTVELLMRLSLVNISDE